MRRLLRLGMAGLVGLACVGAAAAPKPGASAAAPVGTISTDCAKFRMTLVADGTSREVVGEKGRAELPPGSYFLLQSEAEFTDKVGRVWRVRNGMAEKPIIVRAGETTPVALGVPLEVVLTATIEKGSVVAKAEYWGPLGDKCAGIVVEGGALPAPRVRILDEAGKLLARPEGDYCCKFTGAVTWPIPANLTGRLRIVPDMSYGPIAVWSESEATIAVPASVER